MIDTISHTAQMYKVELNPTQETARYIVGNQKDFPAFALDCNGLKSHIRYLLGTTVSTILRVACPIEG